MPVWIAQRTLSVTSYMFNPEPTCKPPLATRTALRQRLGKAGSCLQRGFSLVELMVGLTIGLLVVLAAIGSMVFTQATSRVVGDASRLQQKADAIFRNIGHHVAQAGAYELVAGADGQVSFSSSYSGFNTGTPNPGQIFNIHGLDGSNNAPDTLRVSYENAASHDCLGVPVPPATTNVDNAFYVSGSDLLCKGADGATALPLADGVEDFQVRYAVLTGADQFRLFDAGTVPDWTTIQAVQICLQIAGDNQGNPQPGLVMKGCRGQTLENTGKLRRVFVRTFSLRNALL